MAATLGTFHNRAEEGAASLKLSHTATVRGRTSQPHQTAEKEGRPHPPHTKQTFHTADREEGYQTL
jgi:hypothetical protein